jgi:hypothetical protein
MTTLRSRAGLYSRIAKITAASCLACAQDLQDVFNSAEGFLRTWERTEQSKEAIIQAKGPATPEGVLRAAPVSSSLLGPLRALLPLPI